jgi:Flp pilus assembly protein TadG
MLKLLRPFSTDSRGAIAITFALSAVVLCAAVACALDYSQAAAQRTKLQRAMDMTVLIAAKAAPSMTDQELLTLANKALKGQMPTANVDAVTVTEGRRKVEIAASASYATSILNVIGVKAVPLGASSTSYTSITSHEIALVFDNSGSMNASAGGDSKLVSAQKAANQLVDAMASTQASATSTKFSVVPFTLAVTVGSQYATSAWMDTSALSSIHWNTRNLDKSTALASYPVTSRFDLFTQLNTTWGGCVETRPGTYATTDAAPTSATPDTLFVPMFAPDEPGSAGATLYYPNSPGSYTPEWTYNNSYLDEDESNTLCKTGKTLIAQSQYVQKEKMLCKYKNPPYFVTTYGRGPNFGCTAKPLMRLTTDVTSVHNAINSMVGAGDTNLLEGFMWGWRTLSPNAPFSDGKAYSVIDTKKIIILLTDGMNKWSAVNNGNNLSSYSPMGFYTDNRLGTGVTTEAQARTLLDSKTQEACTNAKNQGIQVYTVGFSVSTDPIDANGLALLQNCASAADMAYVANDSAGIIAVFKDIADKVTALRIAK